MYVKQIHYLYFS